MRSSTARREIIRQARDASSSDAEWILIVGEGERAREGKTRGAITDSRRMEEAFEGGEHNGIADAVRDGLKSAALLLFG